MMVLWTCGPRLVDPVHGTMSSTHAFSLRKINLEIWKIAGALVFLKKHTKLFQNYILVPVILYFGPQLTFYNYDLVDALINLDYFNYLFNLLTSNIHIF
jgi:hypothetical protein